MDQQRGLCGNLVSVAQRLHNLSYVLALNPGHSAALVALREAAETAIRSADAGCDEELVKLGADLRGFLECPMDQDNVNALVKCAVRFHDAAVAIYTMKRAREQEMSTTSESDG